MPNRQIELRDLVFRIAAQLPQSKQDAHRVLELTAAMISGDVSALFPEPALAIVDSCNVSPIRSVGPRE